MIRKFIAIMSAAAVMLCSCNGSGNAGGEADPAEILYENAETALDNGDADLAIALLDSLDSRYRDRTELMRRSMALRPRAIESQCLTLISQTDSLIDAERKILDDLRPSMRLVSVPGSDSYYIAKDDYDPEFFNKTGISGRVTDISNEFYIVSSVNPSGSLHHSSVTAVSAGESVTSESVPFDGASNYRFNNSEMITFTPQQSDTIGNFISMHGNESVTVKFNGEKGGSKSIKLSSSKIKAIATAYDYAVHVNRMRDLTVERERLEARLNLARNKQQTTTTNANQQ